jgi:tRNA A-37 threonylcarbamoyl transferase component Bud32/Tol biopolymer transport system component
MGEVYRARDTKLKREVAVKILPDVFLRDPNRIFRFQREAEALASLNHPNIAAIYSLEDIESRRFLVLELVEGQTLAERIARGPLSLAEALTIAKQVADAMEAAHAKGIVHRDLKPANVKITPEGQVKLLDFGLAKIFESNREPESDDAATLADLQAATNSSGHRTVDGAIIGTVTYMSPEQARGLVADHQSDIWAFGCLLYEMLTGQLVFQGDSGADIFASIIKTDPDWALLPPGTPASVVSLLHRCLQKERKHRMRHIGDAALEIEDALKYSCVEAPAAVPAVEPPKRRFAYAGVGAVVIVLIAIAAIVIGRRGFGGNAQVAYHRLTFDRGRIESARFAPDGKFILYSARWRGEPAKVYTTRIESPESSSLPLPSADLLAISPSGEIALSLNPKQNNWDSVGTFARAPSVGNTYREVVEDVTSADWTSDPNGLALVRRVNGMDRLEYPAGNVLRETSGYFSHIRFSPDNRRIAFLEHPIYPDNRGFVAVMDLTGKTEKLTDEWPQLEGLAWTPSGDEIWFTGDKDGANLRLYGIAEKRRLRQILEIPGDVILHDINKDGRVLLSRFRATASAFGLIGGAGAETDFTAFDTSRPADLSHDGTFLLLTEFGVVHSKDYSVYLRKTDGSQAVRLGDGFAASLSPDKKWAAAVLSSVKELVLLPTGPGEPRRIRSDHIAFNRPAVWFPNGHELLVNGTENGHQPRLYVVPIEGGEPRPLTPEGISGTPAVSPDGALIATGPSGGKYSLFSSNGSAPVLIPGFNEGEVPIVFTADGSAMLVYDLQQPTAKIYLLNIRDGTRQLWKEIRPADASGVRQGLVVVATPDLRSYAYGVSRYLMDLYLADGLR